MFLILIFIYKVVEHAYLGSHEDSSNNVFISYFMLITIEDYIIYHIHMHRIHLCEERIAEY